MKFSPNFLFTFNQINSILFSGIIIGYSAFQIILKKDGIQSSHSNQEVLLSNLNIYAQIGLNTRIIGGIILDQIGPKKAVLLFNFFTLLSFVGFALSSDDLDLLPISIGILGLSGGSHLVISSQVSRLTENVKFFSTLQPSAFPMATVVFYSMQVLQEQQHVSRQQFCFSQCGIIFVFSILSYQVQLNQVVDREKAIDEDGLIDTFKYHDVNDQPADLSKDTNQYDVNEVLGIICSPRYIIATLWTAWNINFSNQLFSTVGRQFELANNEAIEQFGLVFIVMNVQSFLFSQVFTKGLVAASIQINTAFTLGILCLFIPGNFQIGIIHIALHNMARVPAYSFIFGFNAMFQPGKQTGTLVGTMQLASVLFVQGINPIVAQSESVGSQFLVNSILLIISFLAYSITMYFQQVESDINNKSPNSKDIKIQDDNIIQDDKNIDIV